MARLLGGWCNVLFVVFSHILHVDVNCHAAVGQNLRHVCLGCFGDYLPIVVLLVGFSSVITGGTVVCPSAICICLSAISLP